MGVGVDDLFGVGGHGIPVSRGKMSVRGFYLI